MMGHLFQDNCHISSLPQAAEQLQSFQANMASVAMRFATLHMLFQGQMAQLHERGVAQAPTTSDMYGQQRLMLQWLAQVVTKVLAQAPAVNTIVATTEQR